MILRNEEDIIRECLQHHLEQGVDAFIVTIHRSTDKTRDIVRSFEAVVDLIDEDSETYLHGTWQTRMARIAYGLKADWVVPIDGDEFWYGIPKLNELAVDVGAALLPQFFKHFPTRQTTYEGFSRSQMPYFSIMRYKMEDKVGRLAFRPAPKIEVTDGSHTIWESRPNHIVVPELYLRHYSIRSFEQFERKITQGTEALKTHPNKAVGSHWKKWHEAGDLRKIYDSFLVDETSGLEHI